MEQNIRSLKPKKQGMFLGLISKAEESVTKQGKSFMRFEFMDQTATVPGMYWDLTADESDQFKELKGKIVRVIGGIRDYQGAPQIDVVKIIPAENETVSNFIFGEQVDVEKNWDIIYNTASNEIKDKEIRSIILWLLEDHEEAFKTHTAAKEIHHNYPGGLLQHTAQMITNTKQLLDNGYGYLNKDVVLGAIILHDLGKIYEISTFPYERTIAGQLFGHIIIIDNLIIDKMVQSNLDIMYQSNSKTTALHLMRHTILAHHGKLEWGSPVNARIPEAVFIHQIDKMDADQQVIRGGLNSIKDDASITDKKVFGFGEDSGFLFDTNKEIGNNK